MVETNQFEQDEFLRLLAEALRAGPGSPSWHEAVTRLRDAGGVEADEYRLIMNAREHLERGREYRSVRAGAGFTRKVMEAIDQEPGPGPGINTSTIIAVLASVGMLATIIVVAVLLARGPAPTDSLEDLKGMYFSRVSTPGDFGQSIGMEWRRFGIEPVISVREKALRGGYHKENEREYRGGGLYAGMGLPADKPFAVDALIRMKNPTQQVDLQIFITEEPTFENPAATSAREFVVELRDGQLKIFKADGTMATEALKIGANTTTPLLLRVDRRLAVVETTGKVLYAGGHGLSSEKTRYPGVRFLTRGGERGLEDVTVPMMRVLTP